MNTNADSSAQAPYELGVIEHAGRIALALLVALVTYLAFPAIPIVDSPVFEIGSVATDDVISPIAFRVPKDQDELRVERDQAARSVLPIFNFRPSLADSSAALAHRFLDAVGRATESGDASQHAAAVRTVADSFGIALNITEALHLVNLRNREEITAALERAFTRTLAQGVAPTGSMDTMRGDITLRHGDSIRVVRADSILTFGQYINAARTQPPAGDSPVIGSLLGKIITAFFRPTITYDRAATEARREEIRTEVSESKFEVRRNEAIVRSNEVVGAGESEKLRALRDELQARQEGTTNLGRIAGVVLFNALLIGMFGLTVFMFRPHVYSSFRSLTTMAAIFILVIVAAAFVSRAPMLRPELVPIAVVAIVFGVLFDARISIIAAMTLAILIGGQSVFRATNAQFLNLIAGVLAVFSVRLMRQRNQAYYSMLIIAGGYALAAIAIGLTLDREVVDIAESIAWGIVNGVITVPFALLVLPLAEDFTGIDTYPRLLEWSDLNRPLMRQLSLEAPGTYAHTMTIANLAETACAAIGANGLLARVGAYYHDIGKLGAPVYFVENQARGRNPHDALDPAASASIIRNHVSEGLRLAEKHRIPHSVRAFITEHHGTGPITYFLEKSTELGGPPADLEQFSYPGPLPRTAETAIVMLADGVEAATRVLNDPSPDRIREVVDHIVRHRMEQGQLNEAPLTLKQLDVIKQQFTRVLSAAHHTRIDYPASAGGITAEFAS